ncbi:hypothetical protein CCHR01_04927 [Colletotrichum chrysophilum]|uniref:Uncharacterized protein n=1 Tax=Colletotrichum chrysophilum TaxID=1836956 RepID=A0AAD9EM51_9PEZI|nr:hypothetical protein CCHR01_04927 [Colletotrichum chrysophilum]
MVLRPLRTPRPTGAGVAQARAKHALDSVTVFHPFERYKIPGTDYDGEERQVRPPVRLLLLAFPRCLAGVHLTGLQVQVQVQAKPNCPEGHVSSATELNLSPFSGQWDELTPDSTVPRVSSTPAGHTPDTFIPFRSFFLSSAGATNGGARYPSMPSTPSRPTLPFIKSTLFGSRPSNMTIPFRAFGPSKNTPKRSPDRRGFDPSTKQPSMLAWRHAAHGCSDRVH